MKRVMIYGQDIKSFKLAFRSHNLSNETSEFAYLKWKVEIESIDKRDTMYNI